MPIYEFVCPVKRCHRTAELLCSHSDIERKLPVCLQHMVLMVRVYSAPALITGTAGQKQLLAKKQSQRKTRSRAHFKNEVLKTIKDPGERRHFERKYKNTKKVDHTKL